MLKKSIILIFFLSIITGNVFGQIDRENAKFMDTCKVNIIHSDTIYKTNLDNDAFVVNCNCQLKKYSLILFDRWGTIIYKSNNINEKIPFNNYKKGAYVWILEAKYPNKKIEKEKGVIVLKE